MKIVPTSNPPMELVHHGVKGMHWGVRKDDGGSHRLESATGPAIDSGLHEGTRQAASDVSGLMSARYGLQIKSVKTLGPGNPEYPDTLAYVESNGTKNRSAGTIFVQGKDLTKKMKDNENAGWLAAGTGNVKALLTHESAHTLFHAEQTVKAGFLGPKIVGGHIDARNKALKAAFKAAKKEGRFLGDTSGYAHMAGVREELEAELFSQYHWGTNTPNYVNVWGNTLHQEMGVDPTPFKEVK